MNISHDTVQTSGQLVSTADIHAVQGSFVSLLADIAAVEKNAADATEPNRCNLETQTVTFSTDQIPSSFRINDSLENACLKNSLIPYENISYAVTQNVGGSQQFVLLQQTDQNNSSYIQLVPQPDTQTVFGYDVADHVGLQHAANLSAVSGSVHPLVEPINDMVNCASLIVCRSSHGDVNEVTLIPEGEKILSAFQDFSRQSSHKTYVKKKEISAACIKRFTADDLNMDSSESEILKKYLEKSRGIVTKDVKAGLLKKLDGTDYSSASFNNKGSVDQFENIMDASKDHTCRDLVTNQNSGVSDIYIVSSFMETQTSQTASKKGNKIRSQGRKSSAKKKESAIRDLNLEEEQSSDWGTEHRLSLDIEKLIQLSEEDSKVVLKIFPELLMLLTEKDLSVEVEFKQDAEVSDFKACTSIEGKRTYCLSVTGKRRDIKKTATKRRTRVPGARKRKQQKQKCESPVKVNSVKSSVKFDSNDRVFTEENPIFDTVDVRACFGDDMVDDSQNTARVETRDDMSAEGDGSKETASSSINVNCSQTKKRSREYMKGRKKPAYKSFRDDSGKTQYQCLQCSYSSSYSGNVTSHAQAHSGVREYVCEECGHACVNMHTLQRHQLVHSKHRPYPCELCTQAFKSFSVLKQHMSRHLGVKGYLCELCSKGFVTKGDLNKHLRTHTKATPYQCPHCPQRFSDISTKYRHVQKMHSNSGKFGCILCTERFTKASLGLRHLKKFHGETVTNTNKKMLMSYLHVHKNPQALGETLVTDVGADHVSVGVSVGEDLGEEHLEVPGFGLDQDETASVTLNEDESASVSLDMDETASSLFYIVQQNNSSGPSTVLT